MGNNERVTQGYSILGCILFRAETAGLKSFRMFAKASAGSSTTGAGGTEAGRPAVLQQHSPKSPCVPPVQARAALRRGNGFRERLTANHAASLIDQ